MLIRVVTRDRPRARRAGRDGRKISTPHQHEEGEYVLVVRAEDAAGEIADVARAERLDQPEQQAAEHRARDVADAAQHRGGERLEPRHEAHEEVRDGIVGGPHHAGDRRECGADGEGQGDHVVGIDAHQSGDARILRGGAHRAAELGAIHQHH